MKFPAMYKNKGKEEMRSNSIPKFGNWNVKDPEDYTAVFEHIRIEKKNGIAVSVVSKKTKPVALKRNKTLKNLMKSFGSFKTKIFGCL